MGLETIITNLLKIRRAMTLDALTESIYGNKKCSASVSNVLNKLVNRGTVFRLGTTQNFFASSNKNITYK